MTEWGESRFDRNCATIKILEGLHNQNSNTMLLSTLNSQHGRVWSVLILEVDGAIVDFVNVVLR